jgi:hypothetical protein
MTGQADEPTPLELPAVWERLNEVFLEIYSEVLRNTATVKWRVWAWDNPYHFLSATAEFERVGRPEEEDLVLYIAIVKSVDTTVWTSDAAQNVGQILVDGPTYTAPASAPLSSWMSEPLEATVAWLRAETPNFIAYLNREPTPYDVD